MATFLERDFDADLLSFFAGWNVLSDFGDVSTFENKEVVAILVGNSCCTNNARDIVPSLINAYNEIGADRLAVVYICEHSEDSVSGQEQAEADRLFESGMPETWIKVQDKDGVLLNGLSEAVGQVITENLFLVTGDGKQVISEDAGFTIYKNEEHGFPWTEAAIREADADKRVALDNLRNQFFHTPGLHFLEEVPLFRHPSLLLLSEEDGGEKREGEMVVCREQILQDCDLLGVCFSSQGCADGMAFTSELAEMYVTLLAEGKMVEVIFVSSDENSASFDEYFETMPWLAVQYDQREKKRQLAEIFGVTRVPHLTWVDVRSGEILAADGMETVEVGARFFPWSQELMAEGREYLEMRVKQASQAEKLRQESFLATQQLWMQQGHVVLRSYRHHAEVDVDYYVSFTDFATMVADMKLSLGEGKKYYYEIEILKIEHFAQLGWCSDGFEGCAEYSEEGVGDDDVSWGFDGMRLVKWGTVKPALTNDDGGMNDDGDSDSESSLSPFGTPWREGDVLGLAADLSQSGATLWLSVNGNFAEPNGVAFDGVAKDARWLTPALSSQGGRYRVNFGERPFRHSPPDDTFNAVHGAR